MFDVYIGGINVATFFVVAAVAVMFPLQLLLCFKTKRRLIRFLPIMVFTAATVAFAILSTLPKDWSALVYIIFAVYSAFCLLMCIAAHISALIIRFILRKKNVSAKNPTDSQS